MWERRVKHEGLHAYRTVRGVTQAEAETKARLQMDAWSARWARVVAREAVVATFCLPPTKGEMGAFSAQHSLPMQPRSIDLRFELVIHLDHGIHFHGLAV
jgi:hypothetical protein